MCTCGSDIVVRVNAKCDDRCIVGVTSNLGDEERNGYVPYNLSIGGGDYIKFKYCANCGRIQNFKPLSENGAREAILGDEYVD